jgi:hypothetical protein
MQVNTLIYRDRQGTAERIPSPSLETTRTRLLEVIRSKPVPKPARPEPTLFDERAWRRNSRRLQTRQALRTIPCTTDLAVVLGVTTRAVRYWRTGQHAPTPQHWQQLCALLGLLLTHSIRA